MPEEMLNQIENILAHLAEKAHTDSIVLADISGQVISINGIMDEGTPDVVAALAAGDVAAMAVSSKRIGESDPHGSFFHEGELRASTCTILQAVFSLLSSIGLRRPLGW